MDSSVNEKRLWILQSLVKRNLEIGGFISMKAGLVSTSLQPLLVTVSLMSNLPVSVKACTGDCKFDVMPLGKFQSHVSPSEVVPAKDTGWKAQAGLGVAVKSIRGFLPTVTALANCKLSVQPVLVVMVNETM